MNEPWRQYADRPLYVHVVGPGETGYQDVSEVVWYAKEMIRGGGLVEVVRGEVGREEVEVVRGGVGREDKGPLISVRGVPFVGPSVFVHRIYTNAHST